MAEFRIEKDGVSVTVTGDRDEKDLLRKAIRMLEERLPVGIAYRQMTLDAKVKPAKPGLKVIDGREFERHLAEMEMKR